MATIDNKRSCGKMHACLGGEREREIEIEKERSKKTKRDKGKEREMVCACVQLLTDMDEGVVSIC